MTFTVGQPHIRDGPAIDRHRRTAAPAERTTKIVQRGCVRIAPPGAPEGPTSVPGRIHTEWENTYTRHSAINTGTTANAAASACRPSPTDTPLGLPRRTQ